MKVSNPVSILELERLHLGELGEAQAAEVRARMAEDPVAQALFEDIRAGEVMPPLPEARPAFDWRWLLVPALATVVALLVMRPETPVTQVKGGELSIALVAQRDGQQVDIEDRARPDDALKVLVTCAPPDTRTVDVVVYQAGASFPLPRQQAQCGNRVPLEGAFRIGLGDAQVCATTSPPPRQAMADIKALPDDTACVRVTVR